MAQKSGSNFYILYGYNLFTQNIGLQLTPARGLKPYEWYPPFIFSVADCLIGLGKENEALHTIQQAIESGRIDGYLYIGDHYLKSGKTDEAMKSYQQAIDSCLPAGYLSIGDYYRSIGKTDEAIRSYKKAIDAGNINGYGRLIEYYKSIGMI